MRKAEFVGEANVIETAQFRQLHLYRVIQEGHGPRPGSVDHDDGDDDDLNLHAAAHLYASDRHALFLIPHALGYEDVGVNVASLALTVIVHHPAEQLRTVDALSRSNKVFRTGGLDNSRERVSGHPREPRL